MVTIPLGSFVYDRRYGKSPKIEMLNRFFEEDPTNLETASALLSRPGTKLFKNIGEGPIRRLFSQEGAFGSDLFIVSGETLYRLSKGGDLITISGLVDLDGTPEMTIVSGPGFEFLFIADGQTLQFYEGESSATSVLESTGAFQNTDTVGVDGVFYCWNPSTVEQGDPDGSMGDPYLIHIDGSVENGMANFIKALNASGVPGVDYNSNITQPHATVKGVSSDATSAQIKARNPGISGNSIPLVVPVGDDHLAWSTGATMTGGGTNVLSGVPTPDDQAAVSVATIASFVLVVLANSQRFYWINPGETTIAALDFAEAESEPDELINVVAVDGFAWFLGTSSIEVWYPVELPPESSASRFRPVQGRQFSRGVVEGTMLKVNNDVILVGEDNVVYSARNGLQRISTHAIEEKIRLARIAERDNG